MTSTNSTGRIGTAGTGLGGGTRLTRRQVLLAGALGGGALIGGGRTAFAPSRAAAQQAPTRGGTLKTNYSDAAAEGLDPVNYDSSCCTDRFLRPSIFDGLVRYDADGTRPATSCLTRVCTGPWQRSARR
jgi:ABC-type transport system substrate-binding protein